MTGSSRKLVHTLIFGITLSFMAIPSMAETRDAVDARQKTFVSMADSFNSMKKLEDGRDTDWDTIKTMALENAESISSLPGLFPEGSLEGSRSKETVWTKWDKFEKGLVSLETAFEDMSTAAEAQDAKALKKAFKTADRSCKSCHRAYRSKW
ncbi:c-type cytochrome [Enterovibrio norvegicus]|uniref:c-type cytochrome n=1 Tax=Enterovibrio norvegicus TaxID=188144 RepID=UPI0013D1381D|nr:cytochrome c [Enterovibrio norvegicus]